MTREEMNNHAVDALRYFLYSSGFKKIPWYKVLWIKLLRFVDKVKEYFNPTQESSKETQND